MGQHKFRHISLEERQEISRAVLSAHIQYAKINPVKKFFKISAIILLVAFALVGFGFSCVYLAVNFHLTNTDGIVDKQADDFWQSGQDTSLATALSTIQNNTDVFFNATNYCKMSELKNDYPGTFSRILGLANNNQKDVAQANLNAALDNLSLTMSATSTCELPSGNISSDSFAELAGTVDSQELFIFATSSEWTFFKSAVVKDRDVIDKVSEQTGIKSRILVAELVAEQMRLFFSSRGWFEQMISPAKVLTSMTQFSWGVLGMKDFTAVEVENYLKDSSSPFYPGPEYSNMLDFSPTPTNLEQARFERITDKTDHYYAYLYAALFNKEIIAQWQKKGFDISNRPEILATLYNIGFVHSDPNGSPQIGGAEIDINGNKYSFGRIAYDFYYSGELLDEFPQ